MIRNFRSLSLALFAASLLVGCSMPEEIRRIEQVNKQRAASEAARSTNLTGEQIFIRSCNTCHPSGRVGLGPSLDKIAEKYPDDEALKKLIRKGSAGMPAQPPSTINDVELDSLVAYLRQLSASLQEDSKK